jgi:hypothetical protein
MPLKSFSKWQRGGGINPAPNWLASFMPPQLFTHHDVAVRNGHEQLTTAVFRVRSELPDTRSRGPRHYFCQAGGLIRRTARWNPNGHLETRTVAPRVQPGDTQTDTWKQELWRHKRARTELLVAGLAQWVRIVSNRWQEKFLLCTRCIG